ncbi:MAG TPA: hypothetical protein VJI46_01240 [Candidatus Nanoarchaeia archaeon]|nr:hypothetical protein [Candidatus Nanoarchaeia archaeon]
MAGKIDALVGIESNPPVGYQKKLVHENESCPLSETFSRGQIERRIAFYEELNRKREGIPREKRLVERVFALYGWEDTTTVRVYMRETVSRIALQLFFSDFSIFVDNVNRKIPDGSTDKDYGHVVVRVRATNREIEEILDYIKPGSSYYVYDGEKSKYVKGNTSASEFIVTKTDGPQQPRKFWRRNQSFISRIEELRVEVEKPRDI